MTGMKAVVANGPFSVEITDVIEPRIQNGDDVKIRMLLTGICGSDLHCYHGTSPMMIYPLIPGHEGVGQVVEIGRDVNGIDIGDLAVLEPLVACGNCYSCNKGRPNACITMQAKGAHMDGFFSEYAVLPQKTIHKLPDGIPLEHAALIEPYTIGAQVCCRAEVEKNDVVWVIGAGTIGLTVIDIARHICSAQVVVSEIVESRLDLAGKLGVKYKFNPLKCDIENELLRIVPTGPHVVVDAACLAGTLEQAVGLASSGGRVVCLSFSTEYSRIKAVDITRKELAILGSRHQAYQFKPVIDYMKNGLLHPDVLVSHVLPYNEIIKGFELMDNAKSGSAKVLLDWR